MVVLAAVKKSIIVIEYMTKGLCSTIERAEKAWDNTLIQDSLMERLISWLKDIVVKDEKQSKYASLVLMENTFFMLEELKKLQSSQLDYTISELKLVHRESLL